jgi:chromatin remodeling complex protein RSC6
MSTVEKKVRVQRPRVQKQQQQVLAQESTPEPEQIQEHEAREVQQEEEAAEAQEVTESEEEQNVRSLRDSISEKLKQLVEFTKVVKALETDLKKLDSTVKKSLKKKFKKKSVRKGEHRGFDVPVKISDELADFLELPRGSEVRPPHVSSLISQYANAHGLKQQDNKTVYNCDEKMKALLGPAVFPIKKNSPELGVGYSMFNLNSYLKKHYIKTEA